MTCNATLSHINRTKLEVEKGNFEVAQIFCDMALRTIKTNIEHPYQAEAIMPVKKSGNSTLYILAAAIAMIVILSMLMGGFSGKH